MATDLPDQQSSALHFISGLPRAGSTLLSAQLRQNPRFRAGMTGPVGTLVEAMLKAMSMANETSVFIDDVQREHLLHGVFSTFHGGLPADHVSFDTNRMWCAKLPLIAKLFPTARVICCVRDVASIINSVERLMAENAFEPSGIFGFDPGGTVYARADAIGGGNGMVGFAYNALRQAFYGPHSARLLLVTYRTLTHKPQRALDGIYRALGQPPYRHDFENVAFDADEFDRRLGTPGLHRVGRAVRAQAEGADLLPPDLRQKYAGDNFWLDPAANPNGVTIL